MDIHTFSLSLAAFLLAAVASVSGFALIARHNYLLGDLWLLLAFSGLCFLVYGVYGEPAAYNVSQLCDTFFKGIGIPLVATVGLMAVTHQYHPSRRVSAAILGAALAGAVLLEMNDGLAPLRIILRAGAWSGFAVYLCYFAKRLVSVGEYRHAFGVLLLSAQAVVVLKGLTATGAGSEQLMYLVFEGVAASYLCIELFYGYCALEWALARQMAAANASRMS